MILALANQKGGVGKTATALNLGHALAELGRRVLLVDLDPQASLTMACGIEDAQGASMADVIGGADDGALASVALAVGIRSELSNANANLQLDNALKMTTI